MYVSHSASRVSRSRLGHRSAGKDPQPEMAQGDVKPLIRIDVLAKHLGRLFVEALESTLIAFERLCFDGELLGSKELFRIGELVEEVAEREVRSRRAKILHGAAKLLDPATANLCVLGLVSDLPSDKNFQSEIRDSAYEAPNDVDAADLVEPANLQGSDRFRARHVLVPILGRAVGQLTEEGLVLFSKIPDEFIHACHEKPSLDVGLGKPAGSVDLSEELQRAFRKKLLPSLAGMDRLLQVGGREFGKT